MTKPSADQAQASPTKQFFVSMLTRDISLADAILDLLDNCLDGAMRLANGGAVDYAKHFVKIEIAEDHFLIARSPRTTPSRWGASRTTTAIRMLRPSACTVSA
jgi:hypothetical protein